MKSTLFTILLFLSLSVMAQNKSLPILHSHNDYLQRAPFWSAYDAGAVSIEIDVFLKNDTLYVAHEQSSIQSNRTLKTLYINPLLQLHSQGKSFKQPSGNQLLFLIDIKTEATPTLNAIVQTLEQYPQIFNPKKNSDRVNIVISGNRPSRKHYNNFPAYVTFDARSVDEINGVEPGRVGMISEDFSKFSVWNGKGRMIAQEREKVKVFIEKAHNEGLPVRFWATPESKSAYQKFAELGVDFFNTDSPHKAADYFEQSSQSHYKLEKTTSCYKPQFSNTIRKGKPKNIILFIGDGMGINQLMAAYTANGGELCITHIKQTGLMTTYAKDNYGTDSAAAGTAIATGVKTNNRSIGVDANGKELKTLVDFYAQQGLRTGLVTTDCIAGATPAAFYGHTKERDNRVKILDDLMDSPLNYFSGFGYTATLNKEIKKRFEKKKNVVDGLRQLEILYEEHVSTGYSSKTKDLAMLTQSAIQKLKCEQGFFLMIECSGIDGAGHANKTKGVVDEVLNLDKGVEVATQFADTNNETLILITADHETGGMSLPDGNIERHEVEGRFYSHDHTGSVVPFFAYGTNADHFQGLLKNTDLFKILTRP